MISPLNTMVWEKFEDSLVPPSSQISSNCVYAAILLQKSVVAVATLSIGLVMLPFAAIENVLLYATMFFCRKQAQGFEQVLEDTRNWSKYGDVAAYMKKHPLGEENPNFLLGAAGCTFQNSPESCKDSQWWTWLNKYWPKLDHKNKAPDLFQLFQTNPSEVVKRLKEIGNTYRFSIEWSHIEPKKGQYDEAKLKVYVNFCKLLRDHGITPMVTLHHFSEPQWFHDMGSFEKQENIKYFLRFVEKVVPILTQKYRGKPLVEHFCTINEPGIEAFSRYVRGAFSPGYLFRFQRAAVFLKNAIKAHCVAYDKIKAINPNVKVGYVHQYLRFEASNWLLSPVTRYLTRVINDATLNYFKTGKFEVKIPFFCHVTDDKMPKPRADFVGLQYYVVPVIGLMGSTSYHEPMTKMPFRFDPEHLYEAIVKTHEAFKVPVIVTENGISPMNEKQRAEYMARALFAAKKAQEKIGLKNFLGYYVWSAWSTEEWDMGYSQDFSVFDIVKGKIAEKYKVGLQPFVDMVDTFKRMHPPKGFLKSLFSN